MAWKAQFLGVIPVLPLLAAAVLALTPRSRRTFAASISIGALSFAFVGSLLAFLQMYSLVQSGAGHTGPVMEVFEFEWLKFGGTSLRLGWLLDPVTALMLVMITFVGLMIFIFSVGYMAEDKNFTRFFCFLSLFMAAMLGLVISNHLLLSFICWELVGVASYLLIGFWHERPSAAAAAQKAFLVTRIGDLGFFIGMLWLYSSTGTLLFYDHGFGCLERDALLKLTTQTWVGGMMVSTAIAVLLFCGPMGKSGQVPLHVWLPDAMEGPTPVSALIHAATMVAAGVFLVARLFPLFAATSVPLVGAHSVGESHGVAATGALEWVTWVGAITALFAALTATVQTDIKRILAYSTVSQLGFMMVGLGTGGVAVGMFHLLTHAFFKALLFLGAGSVIHGCHEEQDIRRMGGLWRRMPVTFGTYAVGMLALSGFPFLFSGFWSKDEILHGAWGWDAGKGPFWVLLVAAALTAFYMTRQMAYVFFGRPSPTADHAHESPSVMTLPLVALASMAVLLGALGTPIWPWIQKFMSGHPASFRSNLDLSTALIVLVSVLAAFAGMLIGWWFYIRRTASEENEPLRRWKPVWFRTLKHRFWVDELYEASWVRWHRNLAKAMDTMDRGVLMGLQSGVGVMGTLLGWGARLWEEWMVNGAFKRGCSWVMEVGRQGARIQAGPGQWSLRIVAGGIAAILVWWIWWS